MPDQIERTLVRIIQLSEQESDDTLLDLRQSLGAINTLAQETLDEMRRYRNTG